MVLKTFDPSHREKTNLACRTSNKFLLGTEPLHCIQWIGDELFKNLAVRSWLKGKYAGRWFWCKSFVLPFPPFSTAHHDQFIAGVSEQGIEVSNNDRVNIEKENLPEFVFQIRVKQTNLRPDTPSIHPTVRHYAKPGKWDTSRFNFRVQSIRIIGQTHEVKTDRSVRSYSAIQNVYFI